MRLTLPHRRTREEVIQIVDRSFDDAFKILPQGSIQIADQKRSWEGSVMTFSLTAGMGFLKTPISGTVEVTDHDVTITADLGLLSKLIPQQKVQAALETRFRGLLT